MTECPTCKLAMESHSTSELMECCMKQVGDEFTEEQEGICPNCKHDIKKTFKLRACRMYDRVSKIRNSVG